jgi:hypothetical protein
MIAIEKIVLIIIFLIILAICIYVLMIMIKPSGEQLNIQNQIRQCCTLYRATGTGCPTDTAVLQEITCGNSNLNDLIKKIPMTPDQLKTFCGC